MKIIKIVANACLALLFTKGFSQSALTAYCDMPTPNQVFSLPGNCTYNSSAYLNKYRLQQTYVPGLASSVITIKLTLHIFTNSDGTGQWENTSSSYNGLPALNSMMSGITNSTGERYSDPRSASYIVSGFNPTYIYDSKIVYELTNIYYYPNSSLYTTSNDYALFNHINSVDPSRLDEGLPIVINGSSGAGHASGFNGAPAVVTTAGPGFLNPFLRSHLRHELGHCLGLGHTYADSPWGGGADWTAFGSTCGSLDYLDDVFPANNTVLCSPTNAPCNSCYEWGNQPQGSSNNIMGGRSESNGWNTWISALQMGRMRRNMHLASIRKFAKDIVSDHVNTWNITASETWDFDIQMYQDIVVKAGNTLTIKCKVSMPIGGKIKVEKGAQLIIDQGGEITCWCKTGAWKGIEVDGTISQNQNYSGGYAIYQGILQVLSGGTLSKAQCAVTTGTTDANGNFDYNSSGGIVIGSSANFINNQKDVAFLYYHNASGNKSFFDLCNFKTNNALVNNILPDCRVSLYEVDGVLFRGCNFEYNAGSAYTNNNKGKGIYSIDASYSVDQYCGTRCANPVKSTFLNLTEGVYADNSNPLRVVSVKNSNFYDVINNSTYYNTITTPVFENNYVRTASYGTGTGLYLNNCKLYNVRNNTFLQNTSLINGGDVGIYVNNSQAGAHKIYRNSFANFAIGIAPLNNNSGVSNTTDGLKMNCNDFTPIVNGYDVAMMGTSPTVMSNQGNVSAQTATNIVRNIYGAPSGCSNCENKWYIVGTSAKTINHGTNSDANTKPLPQPANSDVGLNVVSSLFALDYINHCPATEPSGGGGTNRIISINNQIKKISEESYANARGSNPSGPNYNFELQALLAEKLNYFLTDSLGASQDSVISLLTTYKNEMHEADVLLTYAYINKGDFANAYANIDNYGTGKQALGLFQKRLITLHQHPKKAMALNNNLVNKSSIVNFSAMDAEWSGGAKAILKYATGQDYEIQRLKPLVENGINKSYNQNSLGNAGDSEFKTYPNPADKSVNFVYKTQSDVSVNIILTNALGSVVGEYQVKPGSQLEINLEHLPAAVYFITAYDGKKAIYQTKVMHLK